MKLTTAILVAGLMTGGLWAQNPNIINNVQSTMQTVQQKKTDDSNAALGTNGTPAVNPATKPAAGAPIKPGAPGPAPAAKVSGGAKAATAPVTVASAQQPAQQQPVKQQPVKQQPVKVQAVATKVAPAHPVIAAKEAPKTVVKAVPVTVTKISPEAKPVEAVKSDDASKAPKPEEKKWAMNGKRDPFFSPIVQEPTGSGCSTGKKCLDIGQINLRGVVKSEAGFIAVVTNGLNKAYFLRENDPVFNGYVVRITGDTVVFQETVQDKLGKPLQREVVKRITTPAV
jgi:Tfp pilus assembly protein PilP